MTQGVDIIPNENTLRFYFYFVQERMNIFWRKCINSTVDHLTDDSILKKYKFTNVYRACDRVSQYLIRHIIYEDIEDYTPEDTIFRILLFKIFNKIDTWQYLESHFGDIRLSEFDIKEVCRLLSLRKESIAIFNNAYMMTGSDAKYDYLKYKHEKWLTMLIGEFVEGGVLEEVLHADSLNDIFNKLEKCTFIGPFLAYQYAIDFNYSPYVNFDENSFVKAGIGAIRGIKKCFVQHGNSYEDAIMYVNDHFDDLQQQFGYTSFRPLPGRKLHLIDLQNCFCETDKYLRAKMPELKVDNIRIKQKYKPSSEGLDFFFPPKWGVTENIHAKCSQRSIKELTISW